MSEEAVRMPIENAFYIPTLQKYLNRRLAALQSSSSGIKQVKREHYNYPQPQRIQRAKIIKLFIAYLSKLIRNILSTITDMLTTHDDFLEPGWTLLKNW